MSPGDWRRLSELVDEAWNMPETGDRLLVLARLLREEAEKQERAAVSTEGAAQTTSEATYTSYADARRARDLAVAADQTGPKSDYDRGFQEGYKAGRRRDT